MYDISFQSQCCGELISQRILNLSPRKISHRRKFRQNLWLHWIMDSLQPPVFQKIKWKYHVIPRIRFPNDSRRVRSATISPEKVVPRFSQKRETPGPFSAIKMVNIVRNQSRTLFVLFGPLRETISRNEGCPWPEHVVHGQKDGGCVSFSSVKNHRSSIISTDFELDQLLWIWELVQRRLSYPVMSNLSSFGSGGGV